MNKQLHEYTETELKAIAFDSMVLIEQNQNNVKIVNQELARRAEQPKQPETPKKK